jgi:3-hydroxyisobutyrate dehydrogenase
MIDAPVSGGTGGAIAGTLTFMVGGDKADLERARRCSRRWAPTSSTPARGCGPDREDLQQHAAGHPDDRHVGGAGTGRGQRARPCKVLSEIMRRSSGGNWALEKYNPMPGVMECIARLEETTRAASAPT